MKKFLFLGISLFVLIICGCLESETSANTSDDESTMFMIRTDPVHAGMLFVFAEKSTATLGTTLSDAVQANARR